jgi:hypothetical protein
VTVKEIIKEYLERNGFDGLWSEDDCGCENSDLFPCEGEYGSGIPDCKPGYKSKCPEDCGEHEWHIGEK